MIIFIVGNIASGKTTTCLELVKIMPDHLYISIDDFRRELNKSKSAGGENLAQIRFIQQIRCRKNLIVETTGTGRHWQNYIAAAKRWDYLIVRLNCLSETCLQRSQQRSANGYILPPIPSDWILGNMAMSIDWMNTRIPQAELILNSELFSPKDIAKEIKKYINMEEKTFKEKFMELLCLRTKNL